ncbi:MAG: tRNA guanosine(34) transglycosylase Tgt, partial [Parvibaculum sp.]
FMPVGTAATVKALYMDQVRDAGADVILGNTYHLMLRPGAEEIHVMGGLHKFANWPYPILTDSGGFQVMSLTSLRKMTEEGVTFSSHLDGSKHMLTPERSIEIQCLLGSDIQMQLDECTPFPATHEEAEKSMELSLRWAKRSREAFITQPLHKEGQALFGIVQGSIYPDLRARSIEGLTKIGFEGYSIGGLAVGEGQEAMLRVLESTTPLMPEDRPRYLMGVGTPDDLVESVARGVDMFDCVMPTRNGRHGLAFTRFGKINLKNARHAKDTRPLDETSDCPAARDYSRAYLHHLIKSGEMLGSMLVSWINIAYYQALMGNMRTAIAKQRFDAFVRQFKEEQSAGDIPPL